MADEQQLVAAVGLQTAAVNAQTVATLALVKEMRADRANRLHALWHTAIGAVVAVSMFAGLWLLLPSGLVVIK